VAYKDDQLLSELFMGQITEANATQAARSKNYASREVLVDPILFSMTDVDKQWMCSRKTGGTHIAGNE